MSISLLVQSAMAFNLICTGSSMSSKAGLRPMSLVYRIDLEANRFCVGECAFTLPIASVSYGEIILQDEVAKVGGARIYRSISRESGAYFASTGTPAARKNDWVILTGNCEKAEFGGFPARKF
jgi:hypothetical protein